MQQILAHLSLLVCLVVMLLPGAAHAFDGGDAAALVFGLIFGILGVFACLGYYARKKNGGGSSSKS